MIGVTLVFSLCLIASLTCAALLVRAYLRLRTRILFWTAISFGLLAINNALAVIDVALLPYEHLTELRLPAALGAVAVMVYCFIWGNEQ